MSESLHLLETVYSPKAKIDREAGIVRDVKILGRESVNGRSYSEQAIDDAVRLYEGARINIDHDRENPHRERGFLEGFAVIRSARKEGDGAYSELHYIKSHPATPVFLEWAERFPEKLGLSHNADGKGKRTPKGVLVESISRINSVDLVGNPATTNGLFESKEKLVSKTLRQILESQFPNTFALCGLLEMDGMATLPVEAPADAGADDQIWAAFKAAIMSAVDDDKLDIKATLKKIGEILKGYEKLNSSSSSSGGGEGGKTEGEDMKESKDPTLTKLLESVDRLTKRDEARGVMDEFSLAGDSQLLESLVKLPDVAAMRDLCKREANLRPTLNKKPKPFIESRTQSDGDATAAPLPKDAKDLAARLR